MKFEQDDTSRYLSTPEAKTSRSTFRCRKRKITRRERSHTIGQLERLKDKFETGTTDQSWVLSWHTRVELAVKNLTGGYTPRVGGVTLAVQVVTMEEK